MKRVYDWAELKAQYEALRAEERSALLATAHRLHEEYLAEHPWRGGIGAGRWFDSRPCLTRPVCWDWPIPNTLPGDSLSRLIAWQDGRCAICGYVPESKPWLCKDHDHTTGLIRGLLCYPCNGSEATAHYGREVFDGYAQRHPTMILGIEILYPKHPLHILV